MKTERRTIQDGKLHDPLDVEVGAAELVAGGTRARDLRQALAAMRERTVIGAGSVVMRDRPAGLFAVGNLCRVTREITE
jgi:hypothetical protein